MASVLQKNDTSLLLERLSTTSCRLVACSTWTRKATEPPGIKLVKGMNGLMFTSARQNVMALKQKPSHVFQFAFKNFFQVFF